MFELLIYALIFLALIGHVVMAFRMYWAVHTNKSLSMRDKNDWKLKALTFPLYYWSKYKQEVT